VTPLADTASSLATLSVLEEATVTTDVTHETGISMKDQRTLKKVIKGDTKGKFITKISALIKRSRTQVLSRRNFMRIAC
jgi:hypothetical protein